MLFIIAVARVPVTASKILTLEYRFRYRKHHKVKYRYQHTSPYRQVHVTTLDVTDGPIATWCTAMVILLLGSGTSD